MKIGTRPWTGWKSACCQGNVTTGGDGPTHHAVCMVCGEPCEPVHVAASSPRSGARPRSTEPNTEET